MVEPLGFEVKITRTNILTAALDLLVLIYPQEWTSLGQAVIDKLPPHSRIAARPPAAGHWKIYASAGAVKAPSVLLVGAPPYSDMTYDSIRQVGRQIIVALAESAGDPPAGRVGVTIIGPGAGLDEVESLRALLFGFMAAIEDGATPTGVHRISIMENQSRRAAILTEALERFWQKDARTFAASLDLPDELIADMDDPAPTKPVPPASASPASGSGSRTLKNPVSADRTQAESAAQAERDEPIRLSTRTRRPIVPIASVSEPSVFVAMPFAARYNDVYYYAILPSIKANHYQCIRLDKVIYTGSVIDTIKKRIETAKLMIAVLDSLNPNVFLEIGYAWGVGTPVLLLVSDDQDRNKLPFDVASYRYLVYDSIRQLADKLPKEIKGAIDGSETED